MTAPTGWLIVQRDLTGSVRIEGVADVWATAVFSTPSGAIIGARIGDSAHQSLVESITMAVEKPAVGGSHRSPVSVRTSPALVEPVRGILRAAGIPAAVDEVLPPDWAEDALGDLAAHLMGRPQVADPPPPEVWALLYQQAAAYVVAAPWERCADDVHVRVDVELGAERSAYDAIVLGNAGVSRGLALVPGGGGVSAVLSDDGDYRPPVGTCHFTLVAAAELPDDVLERAGRYGWPGQSEAPLFLAVGEGGPQDIDRGQAELLTIALAAIIEHDGTDTRAGEATTGELILASGRRARFRAHLERDEPPALPPGFTFSPARCATICSPTEPSSAWAGSRGPRLPRSGAKPPSTCRHPRRGRRRATICLCSSLGWAKTTDGESPARSIPHAPRGWRCWSWATRCHW